MEALTAGPGLNLLGPVLTEKRHSNEQWRFPRYKQNIWCKKAQQSIKICGGVKNSKDRKGSNSV